MQLPISYLVTNNIIIFCILAVSRNRPTKMFLLTQKLLQQNNLYNRNIIPCFHSIKVNATTNCVIHLISSFPQNYDYRFLVVIDERIKWFRETIHNSFVYLSYFANIFPLKKCSIHYYFTYFLILTFPQNMILFFVFIVTHVKLEMDIKYVYKIVRKYFTNFIYIFLWHSNLFIL